MSQGLFEKIRQCKTLPKLSAVALEVINLTGTNVGTNEIADAISKDSALASKVLCMANSCRYGRPHNITNIRHAVALLGLRSVKNLVLFAIVRDLSARKPTGFSYLSYWKRSIYAATAGEILAGKLLQGHETSCFLSALLMDIGMLALDRVLGNTYAEICNQAQNHDALAEAERKSFGLTHADAAMFMAGLWKLPEALAVPVAYHDRPQAVEDRFQRKLTQVTHLAGRCADIFVDAKPAMSIAEVRRVCMDEFNIHEIACDAMLCSISQRMREIAPLFEIPIDVSMSYEIILANANDELLSRNLSGVERGGREKRRTPRVRYENTVVVVPWFADSLGDPTSIRLRDVSSRGIGLTSAKHMSTGDRFVIQLPQKNGKSVYLLYAVVRCIEADPGKYTVGAELERVIDPSELAKRQRRPSGPLERLRAAVIG